MGWTALLTHSRVDISRTSLEIDIAKVLRAIFNKIGFRDPRPTETWLQILKQGEMRNINIPIDSNRIQ